MSIFREIKDLLPKIKDHSLCAHNNSVANAACGVDTYEYMIENKNRGRMFCRSLIGRSRSNKKKLLRD